MHSTLLAFVFGCFLCISHKVAGSATCWYPDGITTEPTHKPCNGTVSTSSCCDPLDSCTTSGLCLGRTGFNYRGSCTDKSWTSGNCSPLCHQDPAIKKPYDGFTPLWACDKLGGDANSYCCSSNKGNCCTVATFSYGNTGFAFKGGMDLLLQEITILRNASSARATEGAETVTITASATGHEATSTSSSATFSISASTLTSAPTPAVKASLTSNIGVIIGASIGVPLFALVVGIIAFLFYRERSKRLDPGSTSDGSVDSLEVVKGDCCNSSVVSKPHDMPLQEVSGWQSPKEVHSQDRPPKIPVDIYGKVWYDTKLVAHEMI